MASNLVIGALRATLGLDTAAFEEGVTLTDRRLAALQKKFKSVGASIGKVGRTLSTGITLPMLVAGGAVLAMSEDFKGAMKEFGDATKDLAEAVASTGLLDFITETVRWVTSLIQGLSATNPELLKWGVLIAGAATVLGPLVLGIGALVAGIGVMLPVLAAMTAAFAVALAASGPLGAFILIAGTISAAWTVWGDDMVRITGSALTAVGNAFTGMIGWAEKLFHGLDLWLKQKSAAIFNWLEDRVKSVGDFFGDLYQRVVGGSFIPDMVLGIEQWMTRMASSMSSLAESGTSATSKAFEGLGVSVEGVANKIGSAFGDAATGTKTWSDALKDLARSLLNSAFSGAGGGQGGGFLGSLLKGAFSSLPGFASGGSFTVPSGGSADSKIAAFRVSPNETVTISKPGQSGGGTNVTIVSSPTYSSGITGADRAWFETRLSQNNAQVVNQVRELITAGRASDPNFALG